ncbi:MAG: class I SAM-dependent methyltransferase [Syntrophorhabdaceae bacterium]|nr:class I SAM-dependent methyltransferase [Syntrophorhabdaceae bacterium]
MATIEYACLQTITGGTLRPGGFSITDRGIGLCRFPEGTRVLDAGCGCGATVRRLRDLHNIRCYGVDHSLAMLAEAGAMCPLAGARLESLPFRNGVFGGIICECVLCLTETETVLREFSRVIGPGGLLILSDLYRTAAAPPGPAGMEIMEKDRIMAHLVHLGFDIMTFEDRTADLKRLAVELILSGHASRQCGVVSPSSGKRPGAWDGIGYYLLVARRTT